MYGVPAPVSPGLQVPCNCNASPSPSSQGRISAPDCRKSAASRAKASPPRLQADTLCPSQGGRWVVKQEVLYKPPHQQSSSTRRRWQAMSCLCRPSPPGKQALSSHREGGPGQISARHSSDKFPIPLPLEDSPASGNLFPYQICTEPYTLALLHQQG